MNMASWDVREGEASAELSAMPSGYVHCVVTSPPYWGQRDYALGETPASATRACDAWPSTSNEVPRRRRCGRYRDHGCCADDGTVWLQLRLVRYAGYRLTTCISLRRLRCDPNATSTVSPVGSDSRAAPKVLLDDRTVWQEN